jgi:hypothetical protein
MKNINKNALSKRPCDIDDFSLLCHKNNLLYASAAFSDTLGVCQSLQKSLTRNILIGRKLLSEPKKNLNSMKLLWR